MDSPEYPISGPPPVAPPPAMPVYEGSKSPYRTGGRLADRYHLNNYVLKRQVWRFFGSGAHIYGPNGELLFFVDRKAFKLKDDIRVYLDESMTTELMSINARQLLDFLGTFDVTDTTTGLLVGTLQRQNIVSAFRDSWVIKDSFGNPTGTVIEDSLALALIRDFLFAFIPRSFHVDHRGMNVAVFRHQLTFFGYVLHMDLAPDVSDFDPRLGLAAGIIIALVESRRKRG